MKALKYHSGCTGADETVHDYYYHRLRLSWGTYDMKSRSSSRIRDDCLNLHRLFDTCYQSIRVVDITQCEESETR